MNNGSPLKSLVSISFTKSRTSLLAQIRSWFMCFCWLQIAEKKGRNQQKGTYLRSDLVRTNRLGNLCPEVSCFCLFLLYSRKGEKTVYSSVNNKITGRNTLHLHEHCLFQIERLWQVTAYLQTVSWPIAWSLSHGRIIRERTYWNSSNCSLVSFLQAVKISLQIFTIQFEPQEL